MRSSGAAVFSDSGILLLAGLLLFVAPQESTSFSNAFALHIPTTTFHGRCGGVTALRSTNQNPVGIDVSDLGLTMEDLNAPLPSELLQGVATTGYESTSRLPDVQDNACQWVETSDTVQATLALPGLRGQPSMALSVLTSTNTISIAAFGRIVWSCILRGQVDPDTATFETKDGSDMIPVIEYQVQKAEGEARWGGFILQIGEDSIL